MTPDIPAQLTYGESVTLNDHLLDVIEKCNKDKADIRTIEQSRQEQAK